MPLGEIWELYPAGFREPGVDVWLDPNNLRSFLQGAGGDVLDAEGDSLTPIETRTIRVRWRQDLTIADTRLVDGVDRLWYVNEMLEVGRRQWLDVSISRYGDAPSVPDTGTPVAPQPGQVPADAVAAPDGFAPTTTADDVSSVGSWTLRAANGNLVQVLIVSAVGNRQDLQFHNAGYAGRVLPRSDFLQMVLAATVTPADGGAARPGYLLGIGSRRTILAHGVATGDDFLPPSYPSLGPTADGLYWIDAAGIVGRPSYSDRDRLAQGDRLTLTAAG